MRINKILVIDCEATCWDEKLEKSPKEFLPNCPDNPFFPNGLEKPSELIEIGWCEILLYKNQVTVGEYGNFIIKPEFTEISQYCTELTGIDSNIIDKKGLPLIEVMESLKRYKGWAWASWGSYDRKLIEDNCNYIAANYYEFPFSQRHLDIKLLSHLVIGENNLMGVKNTLKYLNMDFQGREHQAVDDSINEARILSFIITKTRSLFQNILLTKES